MSITQKIYKTTIIMLMLIGTSGCSTYPNKFKCGDARGLGCTMLRDVDKQIDSGQIEQAYKKKAGKCRGRRCSGKGGGEAQELLRLLPQHKAILHDIDDSEIIDDEHSLYF